MGWVLDDGEDCLSKRGAAVLRKPPKALIVKFDNANWQLEGMQEPGTYPIKVAKKTWHIDDNRMCPVLRVSRTQTPIGPDYARTAYSAQGLTLDAAIVDLCFDDTIDPTTGYIAMSRVRCADDVLIMQGFDIKLFQKGVPLGPAMLLKYLRGEETDTDIAAHLKSQKQMVQVEIDARNEKMQRNKEKRKLTDKRRNRTKRVRTQQSPEAKEASREARRIARDAKQQSPEAKEASKEARRIARDAKQKGRDRTNREQKGREQKGREPQDRTKRVRTAGQLEDAKKKRNEAKQTSTCTNSTQ